MRKDNRGITLIAIVITIIVLLILAGVSIAMLTGNNGILNQAQNTKSENEKASAIEEVKLETAGSFNDDGKYDVNKAIGNLKENLKIKDEEITNKNGVLTVKYKGYKLYVDTKGIVRTGVTAGIIASDPTEYYGKVITNYECENKDAVQNWQIFYADNDNIYLIAKNAITYQYIPDGKKGTKITKSSTSDSSFCLNTYEDYEGSKDILEDGKTTKWISWVNSYPESKDRCIQATAYILDTQSWSKFKGENAEYAIGSPTIEMFIASYNKMYIENQIEYAIYPSGYRIKYTDDEDYNPSIQGNFNEMYNIGGWIASPWYHGSYPWGWICYGGSKKIYCDPSGTAHSFRPIVCLKSNVELNIIDDETFEIK